MVLPSDYTEQHRSVLAAAAMENAKEWWEALHEIERTKIHATAQRKGDKVGGDGGQEA